MGAGYRQRRIVILLRDPRWEVLVREERRRWEKVLEAVVAGRWGKAVEEVKRVKATLEERKEERGDEDGEVRRRMQRSASVWY